MTILPLSFLIFSFFGGSYDMGQRSSDVRGELVNRYKDVIEEDEQQAEETEQQDEKTADTEEEAS